jgi:hypothetical protein
MKLTVCLLGCLALAGCKLIDQTTFAPAPEANTAAPAPPKVDPRTPLLTIGYDTPNPNYQELLSFAVSTAESRAPGVEYDVIAIVPAGGDVAVAQSNAVEVMRTIMEQRVPAERIHLGLRTEPATAQRQVRVYVH